MKSRVFAIIALPVLLAGCGGAGQPGNSATSLSAAEQLASQGAPSYLPSTSPASATLDGSAKEPALTMQGLAVRVRLEGSDRLTMKVSGPFTTVTDDPSVEAADCTWTVEISDVHGTIPLSTAQFNVQDARGTYHMLSAGTGDMPTRITDGHTATFKLHGTVPSGDGMLRWAPDGTHVVALWDYIGEFD